MGGQSSTGPRPRSQQLNPTQILRISLENIELRSEEIGFFLNRPRFRECCFGPVVPGRLERPPDALTSAVCLWGACVDKSGQLRAFEESLLARAVSTSAQILASPHRLKILYGIQVEVLLCQYFLHKGRLVEAQYHLSMAVSRLVLGDLGHLGHRQGTFVDAVEEGEHIIAYWTVVYLDKTWSAMLNFPSHFGPDMDNVDTPWPAEMSAYERNRLQRTLPPVNTIHAFLEQITGFERDQSNLGLLTKAAILLDKANMIRQTWQPNMSPRETTAYFQTFSRLNERIRVFGEGLLPPNTLGGIAPAQRSRVVLAYCVAHAAAFELNRKFIATNTQCRDLSLAACGGIVWVIRFANVKSLEHIEPVVGTIWSAAAGFLAQEIARCRGIPAAATAVVEMQGEYDEIASTLAHFAAESTFMQDQDEKSLDILPTSIQIDEDKNEVSATVRTDKSRLRYHIFWKNKDYAENPSPKTSLNARFEVHRPKKGDPDSKRPWTVSVAAFMSADDPSTQTELSSRGRVRCPGPSNRGETTSLGLPRSSMEGDVVLKMWKLPKPPTKQEIQDLENNHSNSLPLRVGKEPADMTFHFRVLAPHHPEYKSSGPSSSKADATNDESELSELTNLSDLETMDVLPTPRRPGPTAAPGLKKKVEKRQQPNQPYYFPRRVTRAHAGDLKLLGLAAHGLHQGNDTVVARKQTKRRRKEPKPPVAKQPVASTSRVQARDSDKDNSNSDSDSDSVLLERLYKRRKELKTAEKAEKARIRESEKLKERARKKTKEMEAKLAQSKKEVQRLDEQNDKFRAALDA
uniref:Transcription factor domain-containing protein n=1 Tax=Mycena chlorophos TaxID=658473 RepID=A0ABQ0LZJ2_MYCCL|nr:predicted protein [Mycena chlorophos]